MKNTLIIASAAILVFFTGCSGEAESTDPTYVPEGTTVEQVQFLVDANRFEEALDILRDATDDETTIVLLRDTHLHYGNWLMYHADTIHMTDRMPKALRHFRRVLELDPGNRTARSNIEQIEGIYRQMGRDIPEGVAE
jgi:tetratricopeptide (TPR) repeat protein